MKILNTLFLLFLTVNYALAETTDTTKNLKEYDVEIIIFEDAHARYINSETWNQNNANVPEKSDKLSTTKINATTYKNIKPAILTGKYKRINGSSEYNVLFYGAWRQAGLDKSNAFEININELNNNHKNTSNNTIDGQFKLILARYLHIYGQLNYQRPNNQQPAPAPSDTFDTTAVVPTPIEQQSENNYPMNIHRRMRSKELHYIDHPLVGMLIQINPVKTKEKTE